MPTRSSDLYTFIAVAEAAFTARAGDERAQVSVSQSFAALARPRDRAPGGGMRLPACDGHLAAAADPHCFHSPDLARLAKSFLAIEQALTWRRREGTAPAASATFKGGHANAMIVGPGGMEPRTDVWLGVSLLAPHVRYPDHTHPPEETYLIMSPGEFAQDDGPWFEPGIGGSFYNPPGIQHAMRSGSAPLFAFWLLRPA